jgi:hypothetical protein
MEPYHSHVWRSRSKFDSSGGEPERPEKRPKTRKQVQKIVGQSWFRCSLAVVGKSVNRKGWVNMSRPSSQSADYIFDHGFFSFPRFSQAAGSDL